METYLKRSKAESFFKAWCTNFSSVSNVKFNTGGQVAPLIFIKMTEDFFIPISTGDWTWHFPFFCMSCYSSVPGFPGRVENIWPGMKYPIYMLLYILLITTTFISQECDVSWRQSLWAFRDTRRMTIAIALVRATSFLLMKNSCSVLEEIFFGDPKIQQLHNIST